MTSVIRTSSRVRLGSVVAAAAVAAGALGLVAPATASAATVTKTVFVDAKTAGADGVFAASGVDVAAGSTVSVTATGQASFDPGYRSDTAGPDGFSDLNCTDSVAPCVLNGQPFIALIGKVGTGDPVVVGAGPKILAGSGPLSFAVNDNIDGFANNTGGFEVTITYTPPCTGLFCFGS
ncbi:hypothetical protein OG579_10775 [Williamsia herbipolensis]|uniref:Neocarzinostatin family protein n=1 Tax=Williamsia herbipolensis TaxID=1603258 RepID=A0AAU4JWU2_9NOCA|nr:hypothetical protein [Williamsia herbipolensis]